MELPKILGVGAMQCGSVSVQRPGWVGKNAMCVVL